MEQKTKIFWPGAILANTIVIPLFVAFIVFPIFLLHFFAWMIDAIMKFSLYDTIQWLVLALQKEDKGYLNVIKNHEKQVIRNKKETSL